MVENGLFLTKKGDFWSKTALFEDLRIISKSLFICGETAWKLPEAVSLGGDFRETRC